MLRVCVTVNAVRKKFENPKIFVKYKNGEKKVILRNLNPKYYPKTFLDGKMPKLKDSLVRRLLTQGTNQKHNHG